MSWAFLINSKSLCGYLGTGWQVSKVHLQSHKVLSSNGWSPGTPDLAQMRVSFFVPPKTGPHGKRSAVLDGARHQRKHSSRRSLCWGTFPLPYGVLHPLQRAESNEKNRGTVSTGLIQSWALFSFFSLRWSSAMSCKPHRVAEWWILTTKVNP